MALKSKRNLVQKSLSAQVQLCGQAFFRGQASYRAQASSLEQAHISGQAHIRGQGTIEYLVIVAIIVVISLIVVALSLNTVDTAGSVSGGYSTLGGKLGSSGGINVVEAVLDVQGNSLIRLSNNSNDTITLTKLTLGGVDNNYLEQLIGLDSKIFSLDALNSNCPCSAGQKSANCELRLFYTTSDGIVKVEYMTINAQCVDESFPVDVNTVVEPIVPVLELGTLEHPWIINDCLELQDMELDGNYILGNNINCSTVANFSPIGNYSTPFIGTLNGNNYSIDSLNIETDLFCSAVYAGLIGCLGGDLLNVELTNANMSSSQFCESAGMLVGYQNGGTISDSGVEGSIVGMTKIGGLVGHQYSGTISNSNSIVDINSYGADIGGLVGYQQVGTVADSYSIVNIRSMSVNSNNIGGLIGKQNGAGAVVSNSFSSGTITGGNSSYLGGLIGTSIYGIITNSYSNTNLTGVSFIGGLIASKSYDRISNSYSTGSVTGSGETIGGLIGSTGGCSIRDSYSTGNAQGSNMVGGLVGYSYANIYNSYSTGNVTSDNNAGGLVGNYYSGKINNSYSTGEVSGGNTVGGLIGTIVSFTGGGTVTNSYWDIYRSGVGVCCGNKTYADCFGKNSGNSESDVFFPKLALTGDYNVPMQHNTLLTNDWTFGEDANWILVENNYPILAWQND